MFLFSRYTSGLGQPEYCHIGFGNVTVTLLEPNKSSLSGPRARAVVRVSRRATVVEWVTAASLCCFCNVALIFATMKTFILQQVKSPFFSSSSSPSVCASPHSPSISITVSLVPFTPRLLFSLSTHAHLSVEKQKHRCCGHRDTSRVAASSGLWVHGY